MELYIYRTPNGQIADFRPYLDGRDHSFDDHRPLKREDPRWEKIHNLLDPETDESIGGRVEFIGKAQCAWHELMKFPIPWRESFEPEARETAGAAGAGA
jgi:hypothetical protein